MNTVYFFGGLMTIVIAFQVNSKIGGALTVIYVLGLMFQAQKKGIM